MDLNWYTSFATCLIYNTVSNSFSDSFVGNNHRIPTCFLYSVPTQNYPHIFSSAMRPVTSMEVEKVQDKFPTSKISCTATLIAGEGQGLNAWGIQNGARNGHSTKKRERERESLNKSDLRGDKSELIMPTINSCITRKIEKSSLDDYIIPQHYCTKHFVDFRGRKA